MKKPRFKKCKNQSYCKYLLERLGSTFTKGFSATEVINLETSKTRSIGIKYKTSAKDRGLMLNFCPWCGGDIQYRETKAVKS